MVKCWMMADRVEDPHAECHREPPVFLSVDDLRRIGVMCYHIPVENYKEELAKFAKARGYTYSDEVKIRRDLLKNYDQMLKNFYEEHLHKDEEIRYMLDGIGYFDVRNEKDEWIRIRCEASDLLILPAGIYHRFTVPHEEYVHAIRLFQGEPVWTPYNRDAATDQLQERVKYLGEVLAA